MRSSPRACRRRPDPCRPRRRCAAGSPGRADGDAPRHPARVAVGAMVVTSPRPSRARRSTRMPGASMPSSLVRRTLQGHELLLCQLASARGWLRRRIAAGKHSLSPGLGGAQRPPDGARQVALQAAQRLARALALGALAGHEGLRRLVHAHLRHGDAVQGAFSWRLPRRFRR